MPPKFIDIPINKEAGEGKYSVVCITFIMSLSFFSFSFFFLFLNLASYILQSAKEGEPFWESPWGPGRPGWHIECSAMSAAYLGHSFDIHGGGMDLVFPHHENEIAQSCAACRDSSISYWVHNGFVTVDSEKMSKSLGNFFTIRQVKDSISYLIFYTPLVHGSYDSTLQA